ncbi:phosphatidate cytidylyltransferase [Mesorhizobium microcysteis]|uniref:Phosphatidate cytidylyltransferase n=1 Tax=Neoaquamicrobium microcysteis TaxID=2682781 RepID=A0A5D4GZI9_9HYPH|nr:phosphatidate cytidylyltransferase [Mesorhizobium microcysteis]TYR33808.1 phosphatidate cytidylyltransferase [Mesorhizobium microcysteis]
MTAATGRSNLQERVISGVVLIVAVLALTWAGGIWFRLLSAAIGGAILYEWMAMALPQHRSPHRLVLAVLLAVVLLMLVVGISGTTLLLALAAATILAATHAAYAKVGFWPVAGLAYAGLSAISLAALRGGDWAGLAATLFLFAVVWATDILAYFVGKAVGGPKLAPSISPGKTWSGAIGGTLAGIVAGVIVALWVGAAWGVAAMLVTGFALSVVSQLGDLFESSLKRRFGAKDSSQLIPGHGGVMDRVDGLVAAAFAMFVIGALAAGVDAPAHAFFAR